MNGDFIQALEAIPNISYIVSQHSYTCILIKIASAWKQIFTNCKFISDKTVESFQTTSSLYLKEYFKTERLLAYESKYSGLAG